jgi:hypothetical protein
MAGSPNGPPTARPACSRPPDFRIANQFDALRPALDSLHAAGGRGPDRAQRHAARAHRCARHGRRDPCALPVRLSLRDRVSRRGAGGVRPGASCAAAEILAVGAAGRGRPDRRHSSDARHDERPLVRRHHRLHQDRGHSGRPFRPDLSARSTDGRHGHRDLCRNSRRRCNVAQGQGRDGGRLPAGGARAFFRRDVCHIRGRLSRRDPVAWPAELRLSC